MTNYVLNSPKILINKAGNWTLWHCGAGFGLLGGTMLLFGVCFLIVFQYFSGESLHGRWLFALVFALWIFGAACCDKVEEIDQARKIEAYRTSKNIFTTSL